MSFWESNHDRTLVQDPKTTAFTKVKKLSVFHNLNFKLNFQEFLKAEVNLETIFGGNNAEGFGQFCKIWCLECVLSLFENLKITLKSRNFIHKSHISSNYWKYNYCNQTGELCFKILYHAKFGGVIPFTPPPPPSFESNLIENREVCRATEMIVFLTKYVKHQCELPHLVFV